MSKKILLLTALAVLFLAGCSDPTSDKTETITPPTWIQGTWQDTSTNSYVFTSNNITDYFYGDYSALLSTGLFTFEEKENSASVYKYTTTMSGLGSETYTYTKSSDTTLTLTYGSTTLSCTKQ